MATIEAAVLRDTLRKAVAWARVQGYRVRVGGYGVHCVSSLPVARWERDPREDGVCPLGALILQTQPDCAHLPDAAAVAIGAPIPWVEGFADGLDRSPPSKGWGKLALLYMSGLSTGSKLRDELLAGTLAAAIIARSLH